MCSQVSCVKVTYVPACAAFNPAIRAVTCNPPPFSSPISTPHTSVLLFERACCRIWRSTWPSIVTRGCCSELRFPMSVRQIFSEHGGLVSADQVSFFSFSRAHAEYVIERQADLIEGARAKDLASRIAVNGLHHTHLTVPRAAPFFVADSSERNKPLFARAALRAFKLMHDVPAELDQHVARSQILCAALAQPFQRQFTRFLRQFRNTRKGEMTQAVRIRRVLHFV